MLHKPALFLTNDVSGQTYDANRNAIDPCLPPPPPPEKSLDDWGPYGDCLWFQIAELIFKRAELSAGNIDELCDLWGLSLGDNTTGGPPPYVDHKELHATINATTLGNIPWRSFKLQYNGERPSGTVPSWMTKTYEFFYQSPDHIAREMLSNPEFDGHIDYVPYQDFTHTDNTRRYEHLMSGDWAWTQAVSGLPPRSTHLTFICLNRMRSHRMHAHTVQHSFLLF